MKISHFLLSMALLGVTLSIAGPPQVKQTQSSRQMVKTWLVGSDTIKVTAYSVFAKNKLSTGTFGLLTTDHKNQIMVTRNLTQTTLEYRIANFSGLTLGAFFIPANPDLPQPKLCVDSDRRRLIQFYGSGLLEARDFNGNVLWQKQVAARTPFHYENSYFAEPDTLGNITALFSFPVENGWESRLTRFSAEGNLLAAKTFYQRRALHLDISPDGNWTAVLFTKEDGSHGRKGVHSLILDETYNLYSQGSEPYREVAFADGSWAVFMGRDAFWGENLRNSGTAFCINAIPGQIFDHLVVSPAGVVYAVSGKVHETADPYFTDLRVHVKNVYKTTYFGYEGPRNIEYLPHNLFLGEKGTLFLGGRFGLYSMTFGKKGDAR